MWKKIAVSLLGVSIAFSVDFAEGKSDKSVSMVETVEKVLKHHRELKAM